MNGTMNKVILIGNLGDDIKMHQFDDGSYIGRFPLATSESFTARDSGEKVTQTEWHNIVVRNKLAEICDKYVKKGDKVYIEGKLKSRKWQDNSGQDRYTTEVIASEVLFLNTRNSQSDSNPSQNQASSSSDIPSHDESADDLPF